MLTHRAVKRLIFSLSYPIGYQLRIATPLERAWWAASDQPIKEDPGIDTLVVIDRTIRLVMRKDIEPIPHTTPLQLSP